MKRALLLFAFVVLSGYSFGQLTYSPGKTYYFSCGLNEAGHFGGIEFTNSGVATMTLDWEIITLDTITGCIFDMCASGTCRPKLPPLGDFPDLPPGEIGWMKIHTCSGSNPGVNTIRFVIKESGHPLDTLTYIITILNNVSIKENSHTDNFNVYPNPCNGSFMINTPDDASMELFNALGDCVKKENINPGSQVIDVTTLPRGIYFVRISDSKSTSTTRIISL